jgi:hypothetical protein
MLILPMPVKHKSIYVTIIAVLQLHMNKVTMTPRTQETIKNIIKLSEFQSNRIDSLSEIKIGFVHQGL